MKKHKKVWVYITIGDGELYDFRIMKEEPCWEYIDGLRKIFRSKHPNKKFVDSLFEDVSIREDGLPVTEISYGKERKYLSHSTVSVL